MYEQSRISIDTSIMIVLLNLFAPQAILEPQRYSVLYQNYYKVLEEVKTCMYTESKYNIIIYILADRATPKTKKRSSWPQPQIWKICMPKSTSRKSKSFQTKTSSKILLL